MQMEQKQFPNGSPHPHVTVDISEGPIWPECNAIVLCSGGMDSVTLAHYVKKKLNYLPVILFFSYGQKTLFREYGCTLMCSNDLMVPFVNIHISNFVDYIQSSIIGKYKESMSTADTVVPGRNLLLVSFATAIAQSHGIKDVFIAVQLGDNEGYPDCKPEFWTDVSSATFAAYDVKIQTPFIYMNKAAIVKIGKDLGVDYDRTWSCYYRTDKPCGVCPSCIVRKEAGL